MDALSEYAPFGILVVGYDGVVRSCNDAACELLECSAAEAIDEEIATVYPDSVEASVPGAFDTRLERPQAFEEYYPDIERWFDVTVAPASECVYIYIQDVTGRHREQQHTERVRDDLNRVTILNELISDILADLVDAASREEIADTICTRLGETDIYEFAWVGEREIGGDDLVIRAAAGRTGRTLDQIEACLDDSTVPEERAISTGEAVLVQPIGDDEQVAEPIRRAAFADGLQSLLAIPIVYGSSVYGVVGVYTAEQDAFSERERSSFETVGEMAGFAVNATRHRNLLLSDTVVELDLRFSSTGAPLVEVASETDASLTLDGIVPQRETLLCYFAIENESVETVERLLRAQDGVHTVRTIGEYENSGSVEVALDSRTPLGLLAANGVTIRSAWYERDSGDVSVECSLEEDVRRIVGDLSREFDVTVLAKRERERDVTTAREFREELRDRLTDRQENALRTAFFADYFESPRGSNAQEVASALGITGPTLLHHLRAGQRKLLEEYFDVSDES